MQTLKLQLNLKLLSSIFYSELKNKIKNPKIKILFPVARRKNIIHNCNLISNPYWYRSDVIYPPKLITDSRHLYWSSEISSNQKLIPSVIPK